MNIRLALLIAGIALVTIAPAYAGVAFTYSSVSSSWDSFDGYGSFSVYEQGVGRYGGAYGPDGFRGGWSTRDSSGSFGYRYDTDMGTTGNQGGLTSFSVSSPGVRGSWVRGGYEGGYGNFIVGNPRVGGSVSPWGWTGSSGGAYAYPAGIRYPGGYGYYGSQYW